MARILTINGGSSSIRLALFAGSPLRPVLSGKMERVGQPGTRLKIDQDTPSDGVVLGEGDKRSAVQFLIDWLDADPRAGHIDAVGHRIVHGMQHFAPEVVTPELVQALRSLVHVDPEHLPREIELLCAFHDRHAQIPQVVCFDTAFHHDMPQVARQLPIPRRYQSQGVRRYGFHGISYTYLLAELGRLGDPAATQGKVILAHLGSGASMAAVRNGACIDTSMAFTPAAGLVMGTRSGDLDPGLMSFLMRQDSLDAAGLDKLTNHESGMLGISETSADVRDLLEREPHDARAAEALALFCYQARKWVGAFSAVLGGLDTLVFAGGIGENSLQIRARICQDLDFLGIKVDPKRNRFGMGKGGSALISADGAPVRVRIIKTDEESVIASTTARLLQLQA